MINKKYFLLVCSFILIFAGCSKETKNNFEKFYLEDKYYNSGNYIDIDSTLFDKIKDESYVLFTYNNFCNMSKPCEEVFEEYMKKYKIDFISMPFEEFRKTKFYDKVKYAPSIIIVQNGEIVSYLDAELDEDIDKYQNVDLFEKWINKYIYNSNNN